MNRAAFVAQGGAEAFQAEVVEHPSSQAFVQVKGRLAAPGIEAPADTGHALLRVADERRPGVAAPTVVDRYFDQFDIAVAQGLGTGPRRRIDHHLHRLETG